MNRVLYLILAGGRGQRLRPLTDYRPKPLVRFGSRGTVIDFTLNNCLASMPGDAIVLTQYFSEMLDKYLRIFWSDLFSHSGRTMQSWSSKKSVNGKYDGTADAVCQLLLALNCAAEYIVVLAADHVYSVDYTEIVDFHISHGKGASVGAVTCDPDQAYRFGIISPGSNNRIHSFHEKPTCLDAIEMQDGRPLASMGIYVFTRDVLIEYLRENMAHDSHDLGGDILPAMVCDGQAHAFSFNNPDGTSRYWQDVGDLRSFWQAHMDLLEGRICLQGTLKSRGKLPFIPSEMISAENNGSRIYRSLVSKNAHIGNALIEKSVIGPRVTIEDNAVIRNSVILDAAVVKKNASVIKKVVNPFSIVQPTAATAGKVPLIRPGTRSILSEPAPGHIKIPLNLKDYINSNVALIKN